MPPLRNGGILPPRNREIEMQSRKGATLIEVLVAIFVMGIGLIALLTLFPLGALRMAQAIQDEKCAISVVDANAIATMKDIRNDPGVESPPLFSSSLPRLSAFKDPLKNVPNRTQAADPDGPSYPVFVDPIGLQNAIPSSLSQAWVGMGSGGNFAKGLIARSQPSWVQGSTTTFKWFTLLDDLIFDSSDLQGGTPFNFNPNITPKVIRRDIRYSWAYMLQRPRSSDPSIVSCSVVVYNKRPLSLSGGLGLAESTYPAIFYPNSSTIGVNFANLPAPNVRAGDWILDATPVHNPTKPYTNVHAYFYRVVGVNETGAGTIEYEVQQPIRGFGPGIPGLSPANIPGTFNGTIMVLEGIADVYERGLDRKFN
jgi:hypothetical protein